MFKRYTRRQFNYYFRRALYILFAWVLISNLLFFYEFLTLYSNGVLDSDYDFKQAFTANLIVALSAGIIGGTVTVNLMDRWLRNNAFWKALLYIIATYVLAALVVSTFGALYYYSEELGLPFYDATVLEAFKEFFGTWVFLKNFVVWLFIVIGTLIVLMVNEKYGPGVFPDYLLGRYFRPKRERRIFMFADIKNATGIAESLGPKHYFNFLKDFFNDVAPAIVQSRGEVYQYVGDEIVISWKMKHGLKSGNTIRCYYNMKRMLMFRKKRYMDTYGFFPEFKVGIHCGNVMVGEIGKIKREIAFSGDVLNTTSRIQEQCKVFNVDILASEEFADLAYSLPKGIVKKDLGDETLRGKTEETGIVTYIME
ncbi:adenylate/guanylate cyclase domain-containing protein [Rasiella rasia]|uniref:Adenylate/guanylate cyclase domain-containing protein n=1 Tax=Rasiella rasia TaxID=2744027 RepID=A0A6G6GI01_9FLAO|nr:adenylate/guanylate cyclase domain-containing protein [Rasiella rasia]QIE58130.1 adenylate/guanylate cyclase domain-containing protein [Rasiella rasia]